MHLVNAATLELEEFQSNKIPPYAILSHTWGNAKDEVTFRDISGSYIDFKNKPGFQKIEFCATQAMKDGFQYCWVDTCCIDKSSSAELSEAINSMYAWYKNSEICYVYMADVDSEQSTPIESQLENSKWFTRGWTLQELLAPKTCQFFDKTWKPIGKLQKGTPNDATFIFDANDTSSHASSSQDVENQIAEDDLLGIISRSTGIQESALPRSDHSSDSLANRMSWASRRETTRVEDLAYCLMGIFDVNMPLLYGEGDKAFIRLQEEIIKKSTDDSIFAWRDEDRPDRKPFSGLLAPSPQGFNWILTEGAQMYRVGSDPQTYNMTNNGLRIQLDLSPSPDKRNEYYARLNTMYMQQPRQPITCSIVVKMVTPPDSYARVGFRTDSYHQRDNTFARTWINVRQLINRGEVSPMYDRISQIRLIPLFGDICYKGILTNHRFDYRNAVIFVQPGHAIEAKLILGLEGFWGGRADTFGLWLTGDGTRYLEVHFTKLASHSLEELHRDDLEWNYGVSILGAGTAFNPSMHTMQFGILNGELEVNITLLV